MTAHTILFEKYEINGTRVGGIDPVSCTLHDPFVWVDEPTNQPDFSKMPDLQAAYMTGGSHSAAKAAAELRASVKGFAVEMPLDWGGKEESTPKFPGHMPQSVATNEKTTKEAAG